MKSFRKANADDCMLIYELAVPSWEVAYSEILPAEQIDFMLEKMYSEEALKRQMREGHLFYIVLYDDVPGGFISFHPQSENLYILEKLYILPQMQGKGAGSFLVEKAEEYIRSQRCGDVLFELNVNRKNAAVDFYRRLGFRVVREVDEDIGNGFYKNDYVMRKEIINA